MPEEETKKPYIVLKHTKIDALEKDVNKRMLETSANKKYVPYWPLHITEWWTFYQVMVLASEYIYKVSAAQSWTIAVSWIWWTVNVSWCGWD